MIGMGQPLRAGLSLKKKISHRVETIFSYHEIHLCVNHIARVILWNCSICGNAPSTAWMISDQLVNGSSDSEASLFLFSQK